MRRLNENGGEQGRSLIELVKELLGLFECVEGFGLGHDLACFDVQRSTLRDQIMARVETGQELVMGDFRIDVKLYRIPDYIVIPGLQRPSYRRILRINGRRIF